MAKKRDGCEVHGLGIPWMGSPRSEMQALAQSRRTDIRSEPAGENPSPLAVPGPWQLMIEILYQNK